MSRDASSDIVSTRQQRKCITVRSTCSLFIVIAGVIVMSIYRQNNVENVMNVVATKNYSNRTYNEW